MLMTNSGASGWGTNCAALGVHSTHCEVPFASVANAGSEVGSSEVVSVRVPPVPENPVRPPVTLKLAVFVPRPVIPQVPLAGPRLFPAMTMVAPTPNPEVEPTVAVVAFGPPGLDFTITTEMTFVTGFVAEPATYPSSVGQVGSILPAVPGMMQRNQRAGFCDVRTQSPTR